MAVKNQKLSSKGNPGQELDQWKIKQAYEIRRHSTFKQLTRKWNCRTGMRMTFE